MFVLLRAISLSRDIGKEPAASGSNRINTTITKTASDIDGVGLGRKS